MRYLWVEDFNDNDNHLNQTVEELEERFRDFFDLNNDKIIIKKDLSSAIEFLEKKDNLYEVDAFLIDIRFPKGNTETLYQEYFRDIVTIDFFTQNIDDASGIMLYLLLVFRYRISQKKMAFISANISSNNDKLKIIQDMIEIIVKSKYKDLSADDRISYRTLERNLGKNILNISSKEKEWETFVIGEEVNDNVDVDELLEDIRVLPFKYTDQFELSDNNAMPDLSNAQVKYNHVKEQFDKIGFAMPSAFEKPRMGEKADKRYTFLKWESEIYQDSYNAVRSNVLEMLIIMINYLEQNDKSLNLFSDFLKLLTCNNDEKKYYDTTFFVKYLSNIKGIFTIDCAENLETLCERAIKEITALWEAAALPKYEKQAVVKRSGCMIKNKDTNWKPQYMHSDGCYFACHATMKITRNWIGHQGIKNIFIRDVGFVFLICMRGIFNINELSSEIKDTYKACENSLLALFKIEGNVIDDINESLNFFCELNNATKSGDNSSIEIYDKISGLGHSKSKIRREVSMDEIYMLFYHTMSLNECYDEYKYIVKCIKSRTWENWKNRYNDRFKKYKELV